MTVPDRAGFGLAGRLTIAMAWCLAAAALFGQPAASPYLQAVSQLQKGDTAAAIALLEPVLRQSPNDLRALTLMGMALAAAGRREEANQRFRQTLQIEPRFAPALKNMALNEIAMGLAGDATKHLEQLLELTPQDPVAHLALAEIHFAGKDFRKAVAHYQQSGELFKKDPRDVLNLARAFVELNEAERAASTLGDLPQEAGAAAHFEAGILLARISDYSGAARRFELSRSGHPDPYAAGYNLALAYQKGQQFAAAARTLEELVSRGHQKAELFNLLAQAYEKSGKTKEAYEALRTATKIDPGDETNYLDLIALCLDHNNYDLALEIAGIGLARLPQSARLEIQRGVVWAMKGQFAEARKAFEEAVERAPGTSLPYVSLGLVLLQMNQIPEAIKILRRRARQDDYLAQWFLGEALNRAGAAPGSAEENEAIEVLERSVKLNPQLAHSRVLLGKLLLRRGELDRAAGQLERALQIEPEEVAAAYQLAQVYAKKGDSRRAREMFAKVSKAKAEERDQFTSRGLQQIVKEGAR